MNQFIYAHIEGGSIYLFDQEIHDDFEKTEQPIGYGRGRSFANFLIKSSRQTQERVKKIQHVAEGVTVLVKPALDFSNY